MVLLISSVIMLASVLLILVVYIQNPKGGGLSTDFGAAHQMGGVQKTNDFIDKATWSLAILVGGLSIVLTIMSSKPTVRPQENPDQTEQQQNPTGQNPTGQNPG